MESGFCTLRTVEKSNVVAAQILTAVGCQGNANILTCLLSKSASDLMAAPGNIPSFMPTLDPYELDAQPSAILSGDPKSWNSVPLIAGNNHDENSMWICSNYASITDAEYKATLVKMYGQSNADKIYQLYPSSAFPSPVRALIDATSDVVWKCPTKKLASQVAAAPGVQSFVYSFDVQQSDPCKGAQHSDELKFVFYGVNSPDYAKNLSTIMRAAWTSFAAATTPSTPFPNLVWKAFDTSNQYFMQFNYPSQLGRMFQETECDFWAQLQASPQYQNIDLQEYTLCYFQNCYY
jgi:para-nitrobenzyl esterase